MRGRAATVRERLVRLLRDEPLWQRVRQVLGAFKDGRPAFQTILGLEHDVPNAQGRILRQVAGRKTDQTRWLPAEPPLLGEAGQVVDLTAAFPIHVGGAHGLRTENARVY